MLYLHLFQFNGYGVSSNCSELLQLVIEVFLHLLNEFDFNNFVEDSKANILYPVKNKAYKAKYITPKYFILKKSTYRLLQKSPIKLNHMRQTLKRKRNV